jgi:hypothetical protein
MQESFSNLIQLTPPRPLLAAEPQAEMQQLFERFVGKRRADFPPQTLACASSSGSPTPCAEPWC